MNKANTLWRPWDPENIRDPYPMYQRLREEDPVHQSQTGEWIISRYDDARSLLRDPHLAVGNRLEWISKSVDYIHKKGRDYQAIEKAIGSFILLQNPPAHTRIRKFIHQAWSHRKVEQIITTHTSQLFPRAGQAFDFINDFAKPLPVMTIGKILGLPANDYMQLKQWGSALVRVLDLYISLKEIEKINRAAEKFLAYFDNLIAWKRQQPDEGLISQLITLNKADHALSDEELLSTCILLFIAGEETSVGLLGTGLMNLVLHPHQLHLIRENPSLLENGIEELIRFDGPVHIVGRLTTQELTLRGRVIPAHSNLTICLGSANHDPEQFENPDELDVERQPNLHLGFGAGIHYCLGDRLARLQAKIAFETLIGTFEHFEIIDQQKSWSPHLSIRTLQNLGVVCRR